MATPTLCGLAAEKWQQSFARLNRGEPGISGLLSFSEVGVLLQRTETDLHTRTPSQGMAFRERLPTSSAIGRTEEKNIQ